MLPTPGALMGDVETVSKGQRRYGQGFLDSGFRRNDGWLALWVSVRPGAGSSQEFEILRYAQNDMKGQGGVNSVTAIPVVGPTT